MAKLRDFKPKGLEGWEYRNDNALVGSPITVVADTWTKVTCNGGSSSSKTAFNPAGVTRVWDTGASRLRLDQIPTSCNINMRIKIKATPVSNNAVLGVRLYYTALEVDNSTIDYAFSQEAANHILHDGAGVLYNKTFAFPLYVGDASTQRGYGEIQVNCSSAASITDCSVLIIIAG
tara:strand:- start:2444 stop:2971 length:528 start_codon:yes stop_codon:yes gene_type:complete